MSKRPPTGGRGLIPTGGRPPTRSLVPSTPGAMAGGKVLGSQLRVADRPVTQQGLSGMRTSSQGPNRQVLDRSYYLGLLRTKVQELTLEVTSLNAENEAYSQDNASYLAFEKKAEQLANEIKGLRGEMADYNTLMDKLNTDTEIDDILANYRLINRKNEQEARDIDIVFSRKQEKEKELEVLMRGLDTKKKEYDDMIHSMNPEDMSRYLMLKEKNSQITRDLQDGQETLDSLTSKIEQQRQDLSNFPSKQETLKLRQQLSSSKKHLGELKKQDMETPEQEQERLLQQVKNDNQEIASLEKRCLELQDELGTAQKLLQQVNYDLTHLHGERSEQYRDLKAKEQAMKDYFEKFEDACASEKSKISDLESDVVIVLDHISQNIAQSQHMPSIEEYEEMQAHLGFKQDELSKTKATSHALDEENAKLQGDLHKVEELEMKITAELEQLKTNVVTMSKELAVFTDLEGLHASEEEKRKELGKEKEHLTKRKIEFSRGKDELMKEYEGAEMKLSENDTYAQLTNLGHKWQHHEQTNFAMKEYIQSKQSESNYVQMAADVTKLISEYNQLLCNTLSGTSSV